MLTPMLSSASLVPQSGQMGPLLSLAMAGCPVYVLPHRGQTPPLNGGHVPQVPHLRQPLCGHPNGERLDLRGPHRGNASQQAAQGETPGSIEQAPQL